MKNTSPKKWLSLSGALLLAAALTACSPTVAKIESVKLGKEVNQDKEVTKETATFAPKDTVYAFLKASAPGKVTLRWQVIAVKADGVPENFHIPSSDVKIELPGSGTSNYHLPPGDGFPGGAYRLEVSMVDETGAEKDKKTLEYNVTGS